MTTQHTKGEWTKYGTTYHREGFGRGALKMFQCRVEVGLTAIAHCYGWTENEAEANARLIASAPKLLEALELISILIWRDKAMNACGLKAGEAIFVHALDAAIALAKGDK